MSHRKRHEALLHHWRVVVPHRCKRAGHGAIVPASEPNEAAVRGPQGLRVHRSTRLDFGGHADRDWVYSLDRWPARIAGVASALRVDG